MATNTVSQSKITTAKYISWIFLLAIISIVLSGQIDYWMPEHSNMDHVKYREMASVSPEFNYDVIKPFVYRILTPWVAGILPFKMENNFYLLNLIALLSLAILFYYFLIDFKIQSRIAFALTACFVFNRYFFQFLAWDYFQLCDSVSLIIIITALFLIKKKSWLSFSLILIIGVLTKEVVLILIPTAFAYLYSTSGKRSDYFNLFAASLNSIIVFILVRVLIQPSGGEDLINQFWGGVPGFFAPSALAKKFIIAFTPFGLVPLIYFKNSIEFFKKNLYLFVFFLGVISTSFFGNFERLMAPLAPVYFLFLGTLIMEFLDEANNKRVLKKFLLTIIYLAFLSSFYHLWGVVKLPDSNTTLIITTILLLITLLHFLGLKHSHFRILKFWKELK